MFRTALFGALLIATTVSAQAADPGVTDSEIKLGQTMPLQWTGIRLRYHGTR